MKNQLLFSILLILITTFCFYKAEAQLSKPLCVAIGTRYEGWIIPGEEDIVKSASCANKVMECAAIGTRSEGWYVFEKQNIKLLQNTPCRYEIEQPKCMFVGTPNEAWVVPARGLRVYYGRCAGKGVECAGQNYQTEGWYVFNKKPLGLYMYSNCSTEVFE